MWAIINMPLFRGLPIFYMDKTEDDRIEIGKLLKGWAYPSMKENVAKLSNTFVVYIPYVLATCNGECAPDELFNTRLKLSD
jgi:hypothetical protein